MKIEKSNFIKAKLTNSQKEIYYGLLVDEERIKNSNSILLFGLGNKYFFNKLSKKYPEKLILMVEDSLLSFLGENKNITYIDLKNIEKIKELLVGFNMIFDHIIMNPPYSNCSEIWNLLRQKGKFTTCLMPISGYNEKNFMYVKTKEKANSDFFEDARITYDLFITTCDNSLNKEFKTYDDFLFSEVDDNFKPYYEYNRNHLKIKMNRKENAPIDFFNQDTDFVTVNRCCGRDNYFSSIKGLDYAWNFEGKRDFRYKPEKKEDRVNGEVYWVKGLAFIRFNSNKSLKNFISFVYDCEQSRWLINNSMWGLNMGTVSSRCGWAIPQIDWESISSISYHPLWKEGNYDLAVLDVMNLKWNEDKSGVIAK